MNDQATSRPVGLTARQQRFVDEYLVDLNATQAAIRAGYSKKTANPAGNRLLAHVSVKAAIAKGREERLTRVKRSADEVVLALENIGYLDTTAIWNADRSMKHPMDWPPDLRLCVKRFRVIRRNAEAGDGHTDIMWDVEFWPKLEALRLLGMHHGQFAEKVEHTHLIKVADGLKAGRERSLERSRARRLASQPAVIEAKAKA